MVKSLTEYTFYKSEHVPPFWDDFAANNDLPIFYFSTWSAVQKQGYGGIPLFFWIESDGEPIIGICGAVFRIFMLNIFYSAIPYGGFIGDLSWCSRLSTCIMGALKKRGVHRIHILTTWPPNHFHLNKFKEEKEARHIIDLNEEYTRKYPDILPRSLKKNLRRSKKQNIEIATRVNEADLERIFVCYKETMKRNGAPLKYTLQRFGAIYSLLLKDGKAAFFTARKDGVIIGANVLVCDRGWVHDIQLASLTSYLKDRPNDALIDASIRWSIEQGYRHFDFMGSPKRDENLQNFKEKWGARKTETVTYISNVSTLGILWEVVQYLSKKPIFAPLLNKLLPGNLIKPQKKDSENQ